MLRAWEDSAMGTCFSGPYRDGDAIRVSVSVGCTAGVTQHEDVICGMQLNDLDAGPEGRVPLQDAEYKAERLAKRRQAAKDAYFKAFK